MAGLYFGIASLILGIAIITYIVRIIKKEGTPQPYFGSVSMAVMFIVLGIALIIPYL
jgi:hypothetical protein